MNQANTLLLKEKYPELFAAAHRSNIWLEINDGWFGIIDTLFGLLVKDYRNAQTNVEWMKKQIQNNSVPTYAGAPTLEDLESRLEEEHKMIPSISQVKEKFGGLRVYLHGGRETSDCYVDFAEKMSYCVCEVCGSSGTIRHNSWIKVLCDQHNDEWKQQHERQQA